MSSAEPDPASPSSAPDQFTIELCAGGIDDVLLGAKLGVDRIELNSGMAVGGLTPSAALLQNSRSVFPRKLIAMIRPREGGFCYSEAEYRVMLRDAEFLCSEGADGLAIGFLTSAGEPDLVRCTELRQLFPRTTLVFHRAFDVLRHQQLALKQLIDCGFDRILTSGGCATAIEGAGRLARLSALAAGRIEILPAGGIRPANVRQLIESSGCRQIHTAARTLISDLSTSANPSISFGSVETRDGNGTHGGVSEVLLQELMAAVRSTPLPESR